jgi:hypothetical protein
VDQRDRSTSRALASNGNAREGKHVHLAGTCLSERASRGLGGRPRGEHVIHQQQPFPPKRDRKTGFIDRANVSKTLAPGKTRLRGAVLRPPQERSFDWETRLPSDDLGNELGLVESSLAPPLSRQRHGNDGRRPGQIAVHRPAPSRAAPQEARDPPPAAVLERADADSHRLDVGRTGPGPTEAWPFAPAAAACAAETGSDAGWIREPATIAERRPNRGQGLEATATERAFERSRERPPADEAIGGKHDGTESVEADPRSEEQLATDARKERRAAGRTQGMDHVGAGWIVGSGDVTTGMWRETVSHLRQRGQRSVHSEARQSQAAQV